jgi:rod shape determining protein RodA
MGMQTVFDEAVDRIGGQPISARMARKAPIRHIDFSLIFSMVCLAIFGAVMIFSASSSKLEEAGADPATYVKRQIAYIVAGVAVLLFVILFDYRHIRGLAGLLFGGTLAALTLVLTPLGTVSNGAQRWIDLGFFQMQPSEIAKVVVIVTLAAYLSERRGEVRGLDVLVCATIVMAPAFLIYLEPDLGTMMVFFALLAALLLVGGARIRHFLAMAGLGLLGILVVLQAGLLQQYQIDRITAFLDPNPDVRSEAYNLTQSKIAIGSGGLRGKGLGGESTQTTLDFVPEQHTDFIFTAVGEQLGFLGSATLLCLFALLIWRALRIASMARDLFGMMLASGIAALWAFQLFVNVGMTMGIMPITGIPLPFISFGGSSLLTNFIAVGLLLNIHMRRFLRM